VPWKVSDEPDMTAWVGGVGPRIMLAEPAMGE